MAAYIPAPRVAFLDERTGMISREWYRYQQALFEQVGGEVGVIPVASGGTALASGTSGGILGFTGTTTIASSALLTASALVLGGGAGATPSALASLGTTTTVLHGNASGAPSWAKVSLTTTVTGRLPLANLGGVGGTGTLLRSDGTDYAATTATYPNTVTVNQVLYGTSSNVVGGSANLTFSGTRLSPNYVTLAAGTTAAGTAPQKYTAGPVTTTPEDGAFEYDGSAPYFTTGGVRRAITLGNDTMVASVTVTNTVTETTIHTSAVAANELKAGKMYKVTLLGKVTTAAAADFFTLRFKMGSATLITVPMTALNVTDVHFRSECYITIRTIGATGTYAAHVEGAIGTEVIAATPVTGSVDTTTAENMVTTLQWDAAKAGNVFTLMQSVLEVIN